MNIIDKFLEVLGQNPAAPAFIYRDQVMSRELFHQLLCKVAIQLHEKGISAGETVGVSMDHSPLHLAVILALARLGAVSLPVHPQSPPAAQRRLMAEFHARRLIGMGNSPKLEGLDCFSLGDIAIDSSSKLNLGFLDYWPSASTAGRIGLTSGTTGRPGAILYSHEYWLQRIATTVDNCDAQTRLMPGNLHLTMGNISALAALFAGGVVVFHRLHDLKSFATSINLYAVSHALVTPAMIPDLAAMQPFQGPAFPSLRHLRVVGGGLTQPLISLAKSRLTPNVYLPYGLSEVGAVSMASPDLLDSHPEWAGRIKPGVRVEAIGADGQVLPPGEMGELRVFIPNMPKGYHLDEQRSAERFKDGWFHTRDMGMVSADGLVRLDGRLDDRINLGGRKFNPERVEHVLGEHPEVKEAAVFAVTNQAGEQVLMAAVVPKGDVPFQVKLKDFCQERQLGGISPRRFLLVRELPRNASGKLIRSALPELLKALPPNNP